LSLRQRTTWTKVRHEEKVQEKVTQKTGRRRRGQAMGRPPLFKPEYVDIAASLVKNGATDSDVAEALKVSIKTVRRWQSAHADFCQALVVPAGGPDDRVERSLFQRAVGYDFETEKIFQYEGTPVRVPTIEHVPPDVGAQMKWLKHRRPDRWPDKTSVEATGKDGAPLVPREHSNRDMARAIADILRTAHVETSTERDDAAEEATHAPDGAVAPGWSNWAAQAQALEKGGDAAVPPPTNPPPRVRVFNRQTGKLE
jgi:hypothetical protein